MKMKTLSFMSLSILVLVMFMGVASAAVTLSNVPTLSQTSNSYEITVQSNQNETIDFSFSEIIDDGQGNKINFTSIGRIDIEINDTDSQIITITYEVPLDFDFEFWETYSTIFTATGNISDPVNQTLSFEVNKEFCDCQNPGDLEINIDDITNKGIVNMDLHKKFGDDDEWFPLEEIEVRIDIENNGNDDIDDIEVEWGLYNTDSQEWVIEEQENDFNLKDGDDKTITITFQLDDIDELNNGDLVFYVKATGEVDNDDQEQTCESDSESVEVIIEDDFVILDDIEFSEVVQCGSEVQITADVWNIGEEDQDDVYVVIYSKELEINEKIEIGDIDAFDDEKLNAIIKIPENTNEKYYTLYFWVYDEDNDVYENEYDDEESEFALPIKVEGDCEVEPSATVSASLESGGQAGEELVIKALITNTGDELANYELSAAGYADWAEYSPLIEPSTIILGAGESKEVLITFSVNKDVSGEKSFDIELVSDSELIVKQPVQVSIEEKSGFFPGITGRVVSEGNWYLWGIGALNIILVIIIIIVAMRVARK